MSRTCASLFVYSVLYYFMYDRVQLHLLHFIAYTIVRLFVTRTDKTIKIGVRAEIGRVKQQIAGPSQGDRAMLQ